MKVKDLRNLVNAFEYIWIMTEEGELLEHGEERKLSAAYDDATVSKISPDFSTEYGASNYHRLKIVINKRTDKTEEVMFGLNVYLAKGTYTLK